MEEEGGIGEYCVGLIRYVDLDARWMGVGWKKREEMER